MLEKNQILDWCKANCDNSDFSWDVRALMSWIHIYRGNDIMRDVLENKISSIRLGLIADLSSTQKFKNYDKDYNVLQDNEEWRYYVAVACKKSPAMVPLLYEALLQHLADLVEKYKPLRDFEKKMLRELKWCGESGDTEMLGEFCDEVRGAVKRWIRLTVRAALPKAKEYQ